MVQNMPIQGNTRAPGRRPVKAGFQLADCLVREAASLAGSVSQGLSKSQAEEREPVRMSLAGHDFPWAFALTLRALAAHVAPMVQKELQQT